MGSAFIKEEQTPIDLPDRRDPNIEIWSRRKDWLPLTRPSVTLWPRITPHSTK
jgi:hypothetical protein